MQHSELAFQVTDMTETLQRHMRSIQRGSTMLLLLDQANLSLNNNTPAPTASRLDPLDTLIDKLCGQQPSGNAAGNLAGSIAPLPDILAQESNRYRHNVAVSKSKIKALVQGETGKERLQTMIDRAVQAAAAEVQRPLRPVTGRLSRLVTVIEQINAIAPDLEIAKRLQLSGAKNICATPALPQRHPKQATVPGYQPSNKICEPG